MKLIIMMLFLNLTSGVDLGEVGRYEVQIETKQGLNLKAFITIASYDKLETVFNSNAEFKNFVFNIRDLSEFDSLWFYSKFYTIKYPQSPYPKERLFSVLAEDCLYLAKSDIKTMQFISFQKMNLVGLENTLSLYEIRLLQSEPEFIKNYSIDPFEEGYSIEWIISYNKEMKATQMENVLMEMKKEYENSTINCTQAEKSWIYAPLISKWRKRLKKIDVFLIRVIAP